MNQYSREQIFKEVAKMALTNYDIQVKELDFLVEETNYFFKVIDNNGNKYALKIFEEASSTIEDNLAELYLIDIIQENTDIFVPKVINSKDKKGIVLVESKYTDIPKRVALYKWVDGDDFDGNESLELFNELGMITAKMHKATQSIKLPKTISPKKWDKVFYYRAEQAVYKNDEYKDVVNDDFIKTMDFIIPYLNRQLEKYYHILTPQLIHGDLNPWNIRVNKNELRVLDFEEALFGFPVHDFVTLFYYYRYNDKFNYLDIQKSFFEGYSKILEVPKFSEFDLELFMTARRVNFLNYVLTVSENPQDYSNTNIPRVKEFIEIYIGKEDL